MTATNRADLGRSRRPDPRHGLSAVVERLLRLVGLVVFGYWAVVFGVGVVDWLGPLASPPHAAYLGSAGLGAAGAAVSVALGYRQQRARTIFGSFAWLVLGSVVILAWAFAVTLTVMAPA
jgi:hypothetical protein